MLWQLGACDERTHKLDDRNLPPGINRSASASTPLMPLLALDTISPMPLPAISSP